MTTPRTRAMLIVVGAFLLFAGVLAGAAVGNLFHSPAIAVGTSTNVGEEVTELTGKGSAVLRIAQTGGGPGLRVVSNGGAGMFTETRDPDRSALFARNLGQKSASGSAVTAEGGANVGVRANSDGSAGLLAQGSQVAMYGRGDAVVTGDVYIAGNCTGCSLAEVAVNGSGKSIAVGEAVTVVGTVGVGQDAMLSVAAAKPGDVVIGVVDTGVARITVPLGGESAEVYAPSDETEVPAGQTLRVITYGAGITAVADLTGGQVTPGDPLAVTATPGTLSKLGSTGAPGEAVGYALTAIEGGRVVVFLSSR